MRLTLLYRQLLLALLLHKPFFPGKGLCKATQYGLCFNVLLPILKVNPNAGFNFGTINRESFY